MQQFTCVPTHRIIFQHLAQCVRSRTGECNVWGGCSDSNRKHLSFLGLGDTSVPSWGQTLSEGYATSAWHLILTPDLPFSHGIIAQSTRRRCAQCTGSKGAKIRRREDCYVKYRRKTSRLRTQIYKLFLHRYGCGQIRRWGFLQSTPGSNTRGGR